MARIPLVQRVEYLKGVCLGKAVLHLGCSDWPYTNDRIKQESLLHLVLSKVSSELWGIDSDSAGLESLQKLGMRNLIHGDLERLEGIEVSRRFDIIVAGEVIEHLSNPGLFLRGVQRFMHEKTTLVITTVNAYCGFRMLIYALRGRGGISEPVHPDHVAYYSYSTIRCLMERENLQVKRLLFYDLGIEHRPFQRRYLNISNDLIVRVAHQLADGLIVECAI